MKTQRISQSAKRGFTLMELMVAMAITTIIVTVLVSITSIALDTWNRSRNELRASRQAKSMIDTMSRDFESLVSRRGNENEWLAAEAPTGDIGGNLKSTNAADLIFYTAVTDRYDGQIGGTSDKGGDVSCVAYELGYRDPISGGASDFETFVLNRKLVNPDQTFAELLGKKDLKSAFSAFKAQVSDPENFICENVFQFSLTFHVQVTETTGSTTTVKDVPITVGKSSSGNNASKFIVKGTGIVTDGTANGSTADQIAAGRLTALEISVTVISDFGIDQLRRRNFTDTQKAEFLAKNSYQYSKLVQLPGM